MCSILFVMTELAALIDKIRPTVLSGERTLEVPESLQSLFPLGGLARGSRVRIGGPGSASVCMAIVSEASRRGSWVAVVGVGAWGWSAAARAGLRLDRSVFVTPPPTSQWGTVVAALVDAVDVVIVDPTHQVTTSDARRLAARSRERGSVIIEVVVEDGRRRFRWPSDPDLGLMVETVSWTGLGQGHGTLGDRWMSVVASGRRGAAKTRRADVLISADGVVVSAPNPPDGPRHLRSVG